MWRRIFSPIVFPEESRDMVMRLATWNFDRKLVVLSDLDQDKSPSMVYLNCCPFWVRIYDLPLNLRVKRVAQTIANTIPQFMEWNKNEQNRLGRFVRV